MGASKNRPASQQPMVRKAFDTSLRQRKGQKPQKGGAETVEEFMARGGAVEVLPPGQFYDEGDDE